MLSEGLPCAEHPSPFNPHTKPRGGIIVPIVPMTSLSLREVSGLFPQLQSGRAGIQTWFSVGILLKQVFGWPYPDSL